MGSLTDTIETHQFGTSEIYTPLAPSTKLDTFDLPDTPYLCRRRILANISLPLFKTIWVLGNFDTKRGE